MTEDDIRNIGYELGVIRDEVKTIEVGLSAFVDCVEDTIELPVRAAEELDGIHIALRSISDLIGIVADKVRDDEVERSRNDVRV